VAHRCRHRPCDRAHACRPAPALGDGTVARIDPAANRVAQRLSTGGDPVAIAADGSYLWVALTSDRALLRLMP
jgi:DNA-binding beta-propeller fold protein YncE